MDQRNLGIKYRFLFTKILKKFFFNEFIIVSLSEKIKKYN